MKNRKVKNRRLPARFGEEIKFEVKPEAAAPFRDLQENRFEKLKTGLLEERLGATYDAETTAYLRRAANEAAALAWVTAYPLLVFPALFEEKAEAAAAYTNREDDVRARSKELMLVA